MYFTGAIICHLFTTSPSLLLPATNTVDRYTTPVFSPFTECPVTLALSTDTTYNVVYRSAAANDIMIVNDVTL